MEAGRGVTSISLPPPETVSRRSDLPEVTQATPANEFMFVLCVCARAFAGVRWLVGGFEGSKRQLSLLQVLSPRPPPGAASVTGGVGFMGFKRPGVTAFCWH